jgi:hypothetical protein
MLARFERGPDGWHWPATDYDKRRPAKSAFARICRMRDYTKTTVLRQYDMLKPLWPMTKAIRFR